MGQVGRRPWHEEREAQLKRLFEFRDNKGRGYSHGTIGKMMEETRNAIIGKVRRMKLKRDKDMVYITMEGKVRDPVRIANNKPYIRPVRIPGHAPGHLLPRVRVVPVEPPTPPPTSATACSILELTSRTCHFPIGHVGEENFHFCGGPVEDPINKSYCRFHHRMCYTPVRNRITDANSAKYAKNFTYREYA